MSARAVRAAVAGLVAAAALLPAGAQDVTGLADRRVVRAFVEAWRAPTSHFAFDDLEGAARDGSRDAVEALIRLAADERTSDAAVSALSGVGAPALPAVPTLLRLAEDPAGGRYRAPAVWAIAAVGPEAGAVATDLIRLLDEPGVCNAVADALDRIDADPAVALPALLRALDRGNIGCRVAVVRALGRYPQPAAVEALRTVLAESALAREALVSLGRIGPLARGAADDISELASHPNPNVRGDAAAALFLATGAVVPVAGEPDPAMRGVQLLAEEWRRLQPGRLPFNSVCVNRDGHDGFLVAASLPLSAVTRMLKARKWVLRGEEMLQVPGSEERHSRELLAPLADDLCRRGLDAAVAELPCGFYVAYRCQGFGPRLGWGGIVGLPGVGTRRAVDEGGRRQALLAAWWKVLGLAPRTNFYPSLDSPANQMLHAP